MKKVCIIGAGLSGASCARMLADSEIDFDIDIFERDRIGGMCADEIDTETGVVYSLHGPHIFHTNSKLAFDFIKMFDENSKLNNYYHTVTAFTDIGFVCWPINRSTIKKAFHTVLTKDAIQLWQADIKKTYDAHKNDPDSFGKRAMLKVGNTLYELLIKHYTEKQWQMKASNVPAEIFNRVRIEDSDDKSFFKDTYVLMPERGFTPIIEEMLNHERIHVKYSEVSNEDLRRIVEEYDIAINTAMPDELLLGLKILPTNNIIFKKIEWPLSYVFSKIEETPVTNICCDIEAFNAVRITDYTHLFNENNECAVRKKQIIAECPDYNGERLYPIATEENKKTADDLIYTLGTIGVRSLGRCGTYKYINMDQAIISAKEMADDVIRSVSK